VAQVFSHYRSFVEAQRNFQCRFCGTAQREYENFKREHESYLLKATSALPVLVSSLGMLVPYAEKVDSELREGYGKYILHGNQSANFAAMRDLHVTQLDGTNFAQSPQWIRWVRMLFNTARSKNRLCDCAIPAPLPHAGAL
jgi:hypothetical protein